MTKFYTLFLGISLLFIGLARPLALAQNCDEAVAIPQAEKRYATGNFDEVFSLLTPCSEAGFADNARVQAYKIISMTYLAIDSLPQSARAIRQLLTLNPKFEPDFSASPRYKALFQWVRESQDQVVQVTSVSKKAENLLYVPATVMVLTSKDFMQRGYQSLEQVLHDLPGFDVMKGNGLGYSNFYQRGYRSTSNDRTLMLIDGVEENDLVSGNIIISRQYALSDIDRVEVIYGPASTMYGANAFIGVINVITKSVRDQPGPSRYIGVTAQARTGSLNTHYMDGVLSARTPDVALSVTARVFRSDEMDLSKYPQWDFGARTAEDYTGQMNISGVDANGNYRAENYIQTSKLTTLFPNSTLFDVDYAPDGKATAIRLTPVGADSAARLDNHLFGNQLNGSTVQYNDRSYNWLIRAKLQFKDITISYLNWKTDEGGTPWYTNRSTLSGANNQRWISHDRAFSITYNKQLGDKLQLQNLTSYLLHELKGTTNLVTYRGYFNGARTLLELARDSMARATTTYNYRISNQLRSETRLFWTPAYNIDVSSGVELRSGLVQGNYVASLKSMADETGAVASTSTSTVLPGGNNYLATDLGIYSQVTYRATKDLKVVGGLRMDKNRLRTKGGYGTVLNPRLAAIYGFNKYIFKAIYAEAFKDASFFQKYGTSAARRLANPNLKPERVRNLEFSTYYQANKQLSANVVGYVAKYSNAVGLAQVPYENSTTQQFQEIGRRHIWGLQGEVNYRASLLNVWSNFTYTKPLDPDTDRRISDIADYMVNAGADYPVLPKLNWYVSGNYVSARKTGTTTSGSLSPFTQIDPFLVLNSNLTYHGLVEGLSLQLSVTNLLDNEYFVPGIRDADGIASPSRFAQEGRLISIGAFYNLQPGDARR